MAVLTMSSMSVRVVDVTLSVDHRVDTGSRPIRREVSTGMFHIERTVARNDLPFEDTVRHRTEHRRLRIICVNKQRVSSYSGSKGS